MAAALADLHLGGVAHGDVKPENVIVESAASGLNVRLVDLGLGAAADSAVPRGGTRRYLAPEVTTPGGGGDGRKRDLFALGLLLARIARSDVCRTRCPRHRFSPCGRWSAHADSVGIAIRMPWGETVSVLGASSCSCAARYDTGPRSGALASRGADPSRLPLGAQGRIRRAVRASAYSTSLHGIAND
ncbi:MAG: hypothetical protein QM784_07860 [Polyangiaceae bacterium]